MGRPITVYLDMDGVLADFDAGVGRTYEYKSDPPEMLAKGFFRNLPVMPGAKEAVAVLQENPMVDLYIATKPTTKNLHCATEKYEWVAEHFPSLLKKIFMVCDKGHLNGDFLIDDDFKEWGDRFQGNFIYFERNAPLSSWDDALVVINEWTLGDKLGA